MALEWEEYLLIDPDAEQWRKDENRDRRQRDQVRELQAERAESLRYAEENGYDVDPITGQYLEPRR